VTEKFIKTTLPCSRR